MQTKRLPPDGLQHKAEEVPFWCFSMPREKKKKAISLKAISLLFKTNQVKRKIAPKGAG